MYVVHPLLHISMKLISVPQYHASKTLLLHHPRLRTVMPRPQHRRTKNMWMRTRCLRTSRATTRTLRGEMRANQSRRTSKSSQKVRRWVEARMPDVLLLRRQVRQRRSPRVFVPGFSIIISTVLQRRGADF